VPESNGIIDRVVFCAVMSRIHTPMGGIRNVHIQRVSGTLGYLSEERSSDAYDELGCNVTYIGLPPTILGKTVAENCGSVDLSWLLRRSAPKAPLTSIYDRAYQTTTADFLASFF
jgi:ABC-type iron transport system FetAB ATPase subunit